MNSIDVKNLRQAIGQYNTLIDKYQSYYVNLYNEIKNSKLYWMDPHSLRFFDAKEVEKHKIDVSYEELVNLKNLYSYIVRRYEGIGENIAFNLGNRNYLMSRFNNYINSLNNILNNYNRLDYSFASSDIVSGINSQRNSISKMINVANETRSRIERLCDQIKDIEDNIRNMINNFDVQILPYATVEGFI